MAHSGSRNKKRVAHAYSGGGGGPGQSFVEGPFRKRGGGGGGHHGSRGRGGRSSRRRDPSASDSDGWGGASRANQSSGGILRSAYEAEEKGRNEKLGDIMKDLNRLNSKGYRFARFCQIYTNWVPCNPLGSSRSDVEQYEKSVVSQCTGNARIIYESQRTDLEEEIDRLNTEKKNLLGALRAAKTSGDRDAMKTYARRLTTLQRSRQRTTNKLAVVTESLASINNDATIQEDMEDQDRTTALMESTIKILNRSRAKGSTIANRRGAVREATTERRDQWEDVMRDVREDREHNAEFDTVQDEVAQELAGSDDGDGGGNAYTHSDAIDKEISRWLDQLDEEEAEPIARQMDAAALGLASLGDPTSTALASGVGAGVGPASVEPATISVRRASKDLTAGQDIEEALPTADTDSLLPRTRMQKKKKRKKDVLSFLNQG